VQALGELAASTQFAQGDLTHPVMNAHVQHDVTRLSRDLDADFLEGRTRRPH